MSDKKFAELTEKRNQLDYDLKNLEKQIFDLETRYLEETAFTGNIIKGWGDYLNMKSTKNNPGVPRKPKANMSDRVFSSSSKSSPFYSMEQTQEEDAKFSEFRPRRTKKKKNYANYKKDQEINDTPISSSEEYPENVIKKVKGSKKF